MFENPLPVLFLPTPYRTGIFSGRRPVHDAYYLFWEFEKPCPTLSLNLVSHDGEITTLKPPKNVERRPHALSPFPHLSGWPRSRLWLELLLLLLSGKDSLLPKSTSQKASKQAIRNSTYQLLLPLRGSIPTPIKRVLINNA